MRGRPAGFGAHATNAASPMDLNFGRYVLKVNPALLVGGLAGAQTMIAGVAAVQKKSDSPVATLGYSCTAAFGHIFLTTWGTTIVSLMT